MRIIVAIITFLILDTLWLGFIAKQLYINQFGSMLRLVNGSIRPLWLPAIGVYIVLIAGILLFVIPKAHGNIWLALGWGALFGLITYGTYDLTNLAVMANWPVTITLIDILWGVVICGLTSFFTLLLTK